MKLKNKLLILLFFCIYSAFSQKSGMAYYKKTPTELYTKRMDSLNNLYSDSTFKEIGEKMKDLKFELLFNPEVAHFREVESMSNDSRNSASVKIAKITSGYSGDIYYDFKVKKVITETDISGQTYLIEKDFSSYDWVLTKEKLIINGLSCYKAKTTIIKEGRSGVIEQAIVAWYAIDITVSAGPDGFAGLPGLIIQLENEKYVTVLDKIVFKKEPIEIELPLDGKKMTQTEFKDLMKKMSESRGSSDRN
jgi:GLPGLI family protein